MSRVPQISWQNAKPHVPKRNDPANGHNDLACKLHGDNIFQGKQNKFYLELIPLPLAWLYVLNPGDVEAVTLGFVSCHMGEVWYDLNVWYQVTECLTQHSGTPRLPICHPTFFCAQQRAGPGLCVARTLIACVTWISTSAYCLVDCDLSSMSIC